MATERHDLHAPALPPLAELAARQGGAVSREQLLGLGLGRGAIQYRLVNGTLHLVHRHVYAVGHPSLTPRGRLHAALLAVPGSVLSHRTAGALWDLTKTTRSRIDVTTSHRGRRSTTAIEVHTVRGLDERDVTSHDGLATTTVARTLLDLAAILNRRRLDRALEQALLTQQFDRHQIDSLLRRASGHHGRGNLTRALEATGDSVPTTRSGLERAFLRFCHTHHLPLPQTNAVVHGYEVDAHWPGTDLVVELDGTAVHSTPQAFQRDRERDRRLAVEGYRVVRLTSRQLDAAAAHDLRQLGAVAGGSASAIPAPASASRSRRASSSSDGDGKPATR